MVIFMSVVLIKGCSVSEGCDSLCHLGIQILNSLALCNWQEYFSSLVTIYPLGVSVLKCLFYSNDSDILTHI